MTPSAGRAVLALGAGGLGAMAAVALSVPAGALLGATLAVTALALVGGRPQVPDPLRDVAFATIGLTLGAGITPDILSDLARWPASLAAMVVALAILTAAAAVTLHRLYRLDRRTALLATSPGALSYTLALSVEGRADAPAVAVVQSVRLLAITLLVPPLLTLGDPTSQPSDAASAMGIPATLVLLAVACLAGPLFVRAKIPGAWLMAGVSVSGAAHLAGWVEGRPDPRLLALGFTIAGAVIGARFADISRAQLRMMAGAAAIVAAIAVGGSFLLSWPVAAWLDLAHGQVWVAFAPGGVEAMAAIAVALGYDPVYVAVHHMVRLLILFAVLPIALR
ncbi:MAG: AbrB family transcriptional regulator [Pseudomonadota bacterium]